MKICLLSPVRGRPEGIKRFYESIVETVESPDKFEIIFGIDQDDTEAMQAYLDILDEYKLNLSSVEYEKNKFSFGTSKRWNALIPNSNADIFGFGSNDVIFKTKGWDTMLRHVFAQLPDQIGMAYANDMVHGKNLSTHPFVMRKWIDTLGYMVPEWMRHYFVDNFIHSVAMTIKRCQYMPNFVIEHLHPCVQKAKVDEVYDNNMKNCWEHDKKWFEENGKKYIEQEAAKLEEAKSKPNL